MAIKTNTRVKELIDEYFPEGNIKKEKKEQKVELAIIQEEQQITEKYQEDIMAAAEAARLGDTPRKKSKRIEEAQEILDLQLENPNP